LRTLFINSRLVNYAKRTLTDEGIAVYSEPVEMLMNPMPVTSSWVSDVLGEIKKGTLIFSTMVGGDFNFQIGDKFYVDVDYNKFEEHNVNEIATAKDADYIVKGVKNTPNSTTVILERCVI